VSTGTSSGAATITADETPARTIVASGTAAAAAGSASEETAAASAAAGTASAGTAAAGTDAAADRLPTPAQIARADQVGAPDALGIDAARLRAAVLRLARRLRKHELAGLTPSQLSTLSSVGQCGPVRLGDLAAAERIAPSTLTRLVNVLEDRGYLLRQPAPDDARAYLVTVTAAGHDVLERIRAEATNLLTDILLTLPADQRAALDAALPALEQLAGLTPDQPKRPRKSGTATLEPTPPNRQR
jgi:DNA-binding MarR family transcriptional regulator